MFSRISQINLSELRKNYARLYYFGLGFIQLKIDETWRLHFYSPSLPSITEDIHNHRYDFTSRILKGTFTNRLYQVIDDAAGSYLKTNESCNPDISAPSLNVSCEALPYEESIYSTGHRYTMQHDQFHTVEGESCITLLERGPYKKEFAQVVVPRDKPSVCPFSKKVEDEELWKLMEQMLEQA